jgi:hypothetical protein
MSPIASAILAVLLADIWEAAAAEDTAPRINCVGPYSYVRAPGYGHAMGFTRGGLTVWTRAHGLTALYDVGGD